MLTSFIVLSMLLSEQVEMLGSPDYRVRERAFRTLVSYGALGAEAAWPHLNHLNLDVRKRCEMLVKKYPDVVTAKIKPAGYDFYPWVTFGWQVVPDRYSLEGRIVWSYKGPFRHSSAARPELRAKCAEMVYDLYSAGVPVTRIVRILDDMILAEKSAMKASGLQFPTLHAPSYDRVPHIFLTPPKHDDLHDKDGKAIKNQY